MTGKPSIPDREVKRMRELHKKGKSVREISAIVGHCPHTVAAYVVEGEREKVQAYMRNWYARCRSHPRIKP